jgi:Zn-dependent protease
MDGAAHMRGQGLKIGRVFGIPIYLHLSWFIIFLIFTPSLAYQFEKTYPNWPPGRAWLVGSIASLLIFISVILHELGHSVVALRYKVPVERITLFIFGGLSQISREPATPLEEFNIAIAGPLVSFLLAGAFWVIGMLFRVSQPVAAAAHWLAWMNLILGVFNLAPGFPVDGGRLLRAAAWAITHNLDRATRIASRSGKWLAYTMILFGAWYAIYLHDLIDGLWLAFIGWFLLTAAQESYAQVAIREALTGLRAQDVMSLDLSSVPRNMSLEEYGHEVLRTGRRAHLVATDGQLQGLMTVGALNRVPRSEWSMTSVQAAMLPADRVRWAAPEEPVLHVLDRMQHEDVNQMPVLQNEPTPHIVGMVTRDSILRVIQARAELGRVHTQ